MKNNQCYFNFYKKKFYKRIIIGLKKYVKIDENYCDIYRK